MRRIAEGREFGLNRKENLIWIDLEMTGLNPDNDRIIEIATVVTDKELTVLAEGPVFAIHQPDEVLAAMDEWNTRQHTTLGPHRARASEQRRRGASRAGDARVPAAARRSGRVADLRQQHLPGSTILDPPHARARSVLSLPQSRRLDAEDPCEALAAGGRQSVREEIGAPGACRHSRFDSRVAVLPRALFKR